MERKELIYNGNSKKFYSTEDDRFLIIEFKDEIVADDGRKGYIFGKASTNSRMSKVIFTLLEEKGIKTHYVDEDDFVSLLVKNTEQLSTYAVVHNYASASYAEMNGLEEGEYLGSPEVEIVFREEYDEELADKIEQIALKVNEILVPYFKSKFMKIIDIKLEFGYDADGELLLIDEISLDNCRLWDLFTDIKLDADRFRLNLGGAEQVYGDVLERVYKDNIDYLSKEEKEKCIEEGWI